MTCPRQFEFDYVHDLEGEDNTDMQRYFDRGRVLDTALQRTADAVSEETATETVQQLTQENFADEWATRTDASNYPSPASYEHDCRVCEAAIEEYVDPLSDGDGVMHLKRSVGTEVHLEWTDDELGALHGYADNIVRTADGFLIIDYKATYSGSRFPNKSGSDLESQLDGTGHYPSRLKKWLQIAMYCRGLTEHDLYTPGAEIRFMFYGLIGRKTRTPTDDGYTVSVSGKAWDMTDLYREYDDALWTSISDSVAKLRAGSFDPTGDPWELIQENACGDCDYQPACGDALAEEVRFS
jgi:putative RecB family exonuclease